MLFRGATPRGAAGGVRGVQAVTVAVNNARYFLFYFYTRSYIMTNNTKLRLFHTYAPR